MDPISVTKVDHIHRYVTDKFEAAKWYERVFGFQVVDKLLPNAKKYPKAPLDIANADWSVMFALFSTNDPAQMGSTATIAMRVAPDDFVRMMDNAADLDIVKRGNGPLTREDIIRHTATGDQSVYFVDPWGNSIEIITEMTEATIERLGSGGGLYPEQTEAAS